MMAAIVRSVDGLRVVQRQLTIPHQIVRNHWNYQWKPGPYPTTREQREDSAKKYGIHPAKYDVHPDDGFGLGDYPKVPDVSSEGKDPHYPWDFPEHRRNFNETMHIHADMLGEDRYNISYKPRIKPIYQIGAFLTAVFGFYALYRGTDHIRMTPPLLPKQMPEPGKVHYTFEPAK